MREEGGDSDSFYCEECIDTDGHARAEREL